MEEKLENLNESVNEFAVEHPSGFVAACYGLAIVISIPLIYVQYKAMSKMTAKEVVKQLGKL